MYKDKKRPFLEEPVYHGCPISWAERYFRGKVAIFRKKNKEFDSFLKGLAKEIQKRQLTYCDNILLLINGEAKVNWVSPKNSLFRTLIKLYNYDFSARQAVDHIERCYISYQRLLNDTLVMSNEYQIISERTSWDSSIKDYVKLSLSPKRKDPLDLEPYWIRIKFCQMQIEQSDYPYNPYPDCDNKIELVADESTYEDSLRLFDYYNGNRFTKRIIKCAIDELSKNKIIDNPIKFKTKYDNGVLYRVNVHRYQKLKEEKYW